MPISNLEQMVNLAKESPAVPLAIPVPHNAHVLGALHTATKQGIITPYVYGKRTLIEEIAEKNNFDLSGFKITNSEDINSSTAGAIELIKNGTCKVIMKGDQSTASIMSPILSKANNLKSKSVLSHVYLLQIPAYHKILMITDGALNIAPNYKTHVGILENAIELANALLIKTPKIALLSAVEVPTEKMPSTIIAQQLAKDASLKLRCTIEGPLAFDAAISHLSAVTKNIQSDICGDIDIAHVPYIEAGNILAKSLIYLSGAKAAGIILGAKVPVILTSRSDSLESKVLSIALASIFINRKQNA